MKFKTSLYLIAAAMVASTPFAANAGTGFATCNSSPIIEFDGTIVDAAIATPDLSTLVDAVVAADLVDALATTENLTVFAPTNDAFGAMPADVLGAALADVDLLTGILLYHVAAGYYDPRKYIPPVRVKTLADQAAPCSLKDSDQTIAISPGKDAV